MSFRVVLVTVLLAVIVSASAAETRKTCWFKQLTGFAETQQTVEVDSGALVFEDVELEFAYDELIQARSFIGKEIFDNGTVREGKLIYFYEKGVVFAIDINDGVEKCIRAKLTSRFLRECIPRNAEFLSKLKFGDNALLGFAWEANRYVDQTKINVTFMVTDQGVPISTAITEEDFSSDPPVPKLTTIEFYDIRLGVCDVEKFFKVPDICEKGDLSTSFAGTKLMPHVDLLKKINKL